ncbi:MAG: PCYCGC domain-containing protein [Candidatus Obscuribacterales bacterium]|nr:PCYCGC domain-containing protein [Candidatus Obscuribacterales bacterium]
MQLSQIKPKFLISSLALISSVNFLPSGFSVFAKSESAKNNQAVKADSSKISSSEKTKKETAKSGAAKDNSKAENAEKSEFKEYKAVLEPGQFFGLASFGYASAKACPEVMEKLFCYCGCDLTDSHTSLLDCFTSVHGVDCHICQEEAVLANKMHKDGASITEIQKTIDEKYSSQYPFESDTAAYKKYKSTKLYGNKESSTVKFGSQAAGPEAGEEPPKLKPGHEPSKCCSAAEHSKDDKNKKKDKQKK